MRQVHKMGANILKLYSLEEKKFKNIMGVVCEGDEECLEICLSEDFDLFVEAKSLERSSVHVPQTSSSPKNKNLVFMKRYVIPKKSVEPFEIKDDVKVISSVQRQSTKRERNKDDIAAFSSPLTKATKLEVDKGVGEANESCKKKLFNSKKQKTFLSEPPLLLGHSRTPVKNKEILKVKITPKRREPLPLFSKVEDFHLLERTPKKGELCIASQKSSAKEPSDDSKKEKKDKASFFGHLGLNKTTVAKAVVQSSKTVKASIKEKKRDTSTTLINPPPRTISTNFEDKRKEGHKEKLPVKHLIKPGMRKDLTNCTAEKVSANPDDQGRISSPAKSSTVLIPPTVKFQSNGNVATKDLDQTTPSNAPISEPVIEVHPEQDTTEKTIESEEPMRPVPTASVPQEKAPQKTSAVYQIFNGPPKVQENKTNTSSDESKKAKPKFVNASRKLRSTCDVELFFQISYPKCDVCGEGFYEEKDVTKHKARKHKLC